MLPFLILHDNDSLRSIFSVLLPTDPWNELFSDLRSTWFLGISFDLEVQFVLEMSLCSADTEKRVSSSLDSEVMVDHSHGHLCELMLSAKSNLNELQHII